MSTTRISAHPGTKGPAGSPTTPRRPLWRRGVAASVVAAVVTTGLAAVASTAGVSFETGGSSISFGSFAELTLLFSLVGVAMAAAIVVPTLARCLPSAR